MELNDVDRMCKKIYQIIFELVLDSGSYRDTLIDEFYKVNKYACICLFGEPYMLCITEERVFNYMNWHYKKEEVNTVFSNLKKANENLFFTALKVKDLDTRLDLLEELLFSTDFYLKNHHHKNVF